MVNKRKMWVAGAVTAISASLAAGLISSTANADPQQYSAFVGVGSDTLQDISNAFSGFSAPNNYTPVQSSAATGNVQLISFNALDPADTTNLTSCITAKLGGPTFYRANGSTEGRRALSRALDAGGYGPNLCGQGALGADVSNQIDFARSSSGVTTTAGALTYVPLGRDGLGFAYYHVNPTVANPTVTSMTRAQLVALHATGPQNIGTTRVVPCGIQQGSGTYATWLVAMNQTTTTNANEIASTALCNGLLPEGRSQESSGSDLKARGDALALLGGETNSQVIIGFSAANWIARANGVASGAPPAGVLMGTITDDALVSGGANPGNPVVGTAVPYSASSTYYATTVFGRTIYMVVPTARIDSAVGNLALKSIFKDTDPGAGNTATMCATGPTGTVSTFGFVPLATCGATNLKGAAIAGQQ